MNIAVTNREELVNEASRILFKDKAEKLSIRMIANNLGISVGVLYNYYPSKGRLILAVAENYWKKCFHNDFVNLTEGQRFSDFAEKIFYTLYDRLGLFYSSVKRELASLGKEDREYGLAQREEYLNQMKQAFITVLNNDPDVRKDAFDEEFTRASFVGILFDNFLQMILKDKKDFSTAKVVISRLIY